MMVTLLWMLMMKTMVMEVADPPHHEPDVESILSASLPQILEHHCCKWCYLYDNKVDRYFDDSLGWPAFEQAASTVLNGGANWRDGVSVYTEQMRLIFGDMISILNRDYYIADPELREQFEACKAFYEGLFLTPINQAEMNNYLSSVRAEMNIL